MSALPVACSLAPNAFADRVEWIAALNREFLRESRFEERSLRLTFDSEAAAQIRELVARERECCAFLRFEIQSLLT